MPPKSARGLAACAAVVASLLGAPSVAQAGTVSATIPNAFVSVYDCSELGTRCSYDSTYQLNPPFDVGAPSIYVNRYEFVEGRHCRHDCRPPRHHQRDRATRRHS